MEDEQDIEIFVIDDDQSMRDSLSRFLSRSGFAVSVFEQPQSALDRLNERMPDLVISDVRMPGMSGLDFLSLLRKTQPNLPVVMISAHGDVPMAVQAMQDGAYSFLEKPFDPRRLQTVVRHAAQAHRLSNENARLRDRISKLAGLDRVLLGESLAMRQIREDILDLADTDASILVLGETGTGKEVVARAIHDLSGRVSHPFVAVNCAAIPENLFEASMFGHVAGAFTGATKASKGYFASAHKGTLFLDELGTFPLEQQAKLLRAIDTQEVTPVGSSVSIPVNIRIVSATNDDLEKAVAEGRFREDLYYRLNTLDIELPPLRDRIEDIPLLFIHFLKIYAKSYETDIPDLNSVDRSNLMAKAWPGNVRELRHFAERSILQYRRGRVETGKLFSNPSSDLDLSSQSLKEAVEGFEKTFISRILQEHHGRMDETARRLGISRRTLNDRLVKLAIDRKDFI